MIKSEPKMNAFFSKIKKNLRNDPLPLSLHCKIQNYSWGQKGLKSFIPSLLGIQAEKNKHYAELWISAHPLKPSTVRTEGRRVCLNDLVSALPDEMIGNNLKKSFGIQLPFLMKILTADRPLSIQAHPNKKQAEKGFNLEELKKIPLTSPKRNYRDENQKPELIAALTDFYALNQFKPLKEIDKTFKKHKELKKIAPLNKRWDKQSERKILKTIYKNFMTCPDPEANKILSSLINKIKEENKKKPFNKNNFKYWILKADREYSAKKKKDRGLFFFFLLNFVHLKPGEALCVKTGELHTYLEGTGVEVMANSDNVLRGGLTSKKTDISELAEILNFKTEIPKIVRMDRYGNYKTSNKEFELRRIQLKKKDCFNRQGNGAEIFLILSGEIKIETGQTLTTAKQGEVFLIPAILKKYQITAKTDHTVLFRCSTGNK